MTTKKSDEYYWIDVKKSVEKSAEALRGFNKAAGQFGYNLERMQRAVETPSYIMPSGLTRMERRDWCFEKLSSERLKQVIESPVYGISGDLTREEHLREWLGDWRVDEDVDGF